MGAAELDFALSIGSFRDARVAKKEIKFMDGQVARGVESLFERDIVAYVRDSVESAIQASGVFRTIIHGSGGADYQLGGTVTAFHVRLESTGAFSDPRRVAVCEVDVELRDGTSGLLVWSGSGTGEAEVGGPEDFSTSFREATGDAASQIATELAKVMSHLAATESVSTVQPSVTPQPPAQQMQQQMQGPTIVIAGDGQPSVQENATVTFTSDPPGARVYLNGKWVGDTPTGQLTLPASEHLLRVEKDGFEPVVEAITLLPGGNRTFHVDLVPAAP